MKQSYTLVVNGHSHTVEAEPDMPLLWVLRDFLQLTGTKFGCGVASCGACTVLVNGEATRSCIVQMQNTAGLRITTIEGLSPEGELHPMQAAFRQCHGLQCGFCTPGMVMTSVLLLKDKPGATEQDIRDGLEGNICRCTGYHNIVKSIQLCQSGKADATATSA